MGRNNEQDFDWLNVFNWLQSWLPSLNYRLNRVLCTLSMGKKKNKHKFMNYFHGKKKEQLKPYKRGSCKKIFLTSYNISKCFTKKKKNFSFSYFSCRYIPGAFCNLPRFSSLLFLKVTSPLFSHFFKKIAKLLMTTLSGFMTLKALRELFKLKPQNNILTTFIRWTAREERWKVA